MTCSCCENEWPSVPTRSSSHHGPGRHNPRGRARSRTGSWRSHPVWKQAGRGEATPKGKRALAGSVGRGKPGFGREEANPDECVRSASRDSRRPGGSPELLSCGNHLHAGIYVWARHQESLGRTVTCLCAADRGGKVEQTFACDKRGVPTQQTARIGTRHPLWNLVQAPGRPCR